MKGRGRRGLIRLNAYDGACEMCVRVMTRFYAPNYRFFPKRVIKVIINAPSSFVGLLLAESNRG